MRKFIYPLIVVMLLLFSTNVNSETPISNENKIITLFMYNFCTNINWSENKSVSIGVYEDDELFNVMTTALKSKKIKGNALKIKPIKSGDMLNNIDLLYVNNSDFIKNNKKSQFLMITNKAIDAFNYNVAINFVNVDGKFGFSVNNKKFKELNLAMSGKVLSLAQDIVD